MRSPEVDLARFLAMILMAIYHLAFDLQSFYDWDIDLDRLPWRILQQTTLHAFLALVGVSAVLMRQRTTVTVPYRIFLRRALTILSSAMVITLVTALIDPASSIRFGVLHCIGVSLIFLPLFLPLGAWNAVLGMGILLIGNTIGTIVMETSLLLPFGIVPPGFTSLDYVPLFPNLGTILLGIGFGHVLYVRGVRSSTWQSPAWMRTISVPGKYALAFYLVHQVVILAILFVVLGRPIHQP